MADPVIAFFEIEEWEKQYLAQRTCKERPCAISSERLTPQTVERAKDAEVVSVFIYSDLSRPTLDKLPNLKMVATRSTGYDHVDLAECSRRGITVSNVPYYGENTVAEHAFGLVLALSRKIHKAVVRTSRLDFSLENLRGFDLKDRTIGVVGAGRIGLHVVRIAKGFGMRVLVSDVRHERLLAEVLGFTYVSLADLLKEADVITLHVPLNQHTHHLINSGNIKLIKPGAILVNTARGAVVETEALIAALDQGILSGAGLDVFEGEEAVKEESALLVRGLPSQKMREIILSYALLQRENVVITPHIAFHSEEALRRIMETTHDNIEAFLKGEKLNVVSGAP